MTTNSRVIIGHKAIGKANPVYVIAEAGVNHNGDPATARRLIDAAHAAGADAVKFQVFSADRLVAPAAPSCSYQQQHDAHAVTQHEMLKRLELHPAAFVELAVHAADLAIDFLATPFGVQEVAQLVELKVPAIKIASPDIVNVPLLEAAVATGLPLILSTGAATSAEIDQAVALIHSHGAQGRLILLHCVSAYPTNPHQACLRRIRTLAERYALPVGFSDHTPDAEFSTLAAAAGAVILEKHLTLDQNSPGPDHFFSLTPEQFARYVASARDVEAVLGSGEIGVSPSEVEVRKLARGSIISASAISAGQAITANCLKIRRPGEGISPARWHDLIGRRAKTDIPANTPLEWQMIAE
jgi:N-acetylneuraminate synthase/N,N'-diacetyllegionaminate synthase